MRYGKILPKFFFAIDPNSIALKSCLRNFCREKIPANGDNIFKGKLDNNENEDWLREEVKGWKQSMEPELQSFQEFMEIEDGYERFQ